jgi:hypothetical protein
MADDIWRTRAVLRLCGLNMAVLLTRVFSTVEQSTTSIPAIERRSPMFDYRYTIITRMSKMTLFLLATLIADDALLYLAAIATSRYSLFASAAKPFVARPHALVLSTWHSVSTNLTAAPTGMVVSF